MKSIFVCQIYDNLADKVIHTFMAANEEHARDQFRRFLDSVKKYSDPVNFFLIYSDTAVIIESKADYWSYLDEHHEDVESYKDVGFNTEDFEDESES